MYRHKNLTTFLFLISRKEDLWKNEEKSSARTDTKERTADETNEEGCDETNEEGCNENDSDDDLLQAPCYHFYETFGEEIDRVSQTCCDTIDLEQPANSEASEDISSAQISTKRKQVT